MLTHPDVQHIDPEPAALVRRKYVVPTRSQAIADQVECLLILPDARICDDIERHTCQCVDLHLCDQIVRAISGEVISTIRSGRTPSLATSKVLQLVLLAHASNHCNIWAIWPQARHIPGDPHIIQHHRCGIVAQACPEDIRQVVAGVLMLLVMHNEVLLFGIECILESQRQLVEGLTTAWQHTPHIAPAIVIVVGLRCVGLSARMYQLSLSSWLDLPE